MKPTVAEPTSTDHLQLIARQKWTILQAVVVVLAVAGVFLLRATPVYRASATLLAKTDEPQISPREELPMVAQALRLDGGRSAETQKRLVKSWPVVSRALRRMGDETPVEEAMKRVKVATFKDMDVVEVSAEDINPDRAARFANEIAKSYISLSQLAARESACTAKDFVKGQLTKTRIELAAAEERLRAFKRSHQIASLPEETKADIEALSNLGATQDQAEAAVGPALARVERLQRLVDAQPERQVGSVTMDRNPLIERLAGDVADLETQQAGLLVEATEDNPAAKALAARVAEARRGLEAEATRVLRSEETLLNPVRQSVLESLCEAKAESLVAQKKASNLGRILHARERGLTKLPDEMLALVRLERDATTAERLFASLTQKYEEFRLAEAMRLAPARLVEPAVRPAYPVRPRKLLTLSFALMMGILLGLALASLRDRLDDSIRSAEQIIDITSLPVLGTVPHLGKDAAAAVDPSGRSAASEAYRILRTNLRFSTVDSDIRTLLITSAIPGEGKTTVALNLAAAVASEGRKVVLVEADLRRASLRDRALINPKAGLTEVLVGGAPLADALTQSHVEGLELIVCGRIPPNPCELLASNKMRQLLDDLSQRYDLVVLDSPPLCPLADAALLANITDAALLITSIGITRRGALEQCLSLLANAKARVIGTVINRAPRSGGGYRRGYYYYAYYDSGGDGQRRRRRDASSRAETAA